MCEVGSFNSTPSLFTLPSRLYTLIGNNTLPLLSSHAPTSPRPHPSNNWIARRTHRHPLSPPHLGSPRPWPGLEFVCVRERERGGGRKCLNNERWWGFSHLDSDVRPVRDRTLILPHVRNHTATVLLLHPSHLLQSIGISLPPCLLIFPTLFSIFTLTPFSTFHPSPMILSIL